MALREQLQDVFKKFKVSKTLEELGYGSNSMPSELFLSYEMANHCAKLLRDTSSSGDSIRFAKSVGDLLFNPSSKISTIALDGYLAALAMAGEEIFKLPVERWCMSLLDKEAKGLSDESWIKTNLTEIFYDAWSWRHLNELGISVSEHDLCSAIRNRHAKLDSLLHKNFQISVNSVDTCGQGSSAAGWLTQYYEQCRNKACPAWVYATICLLATGPLQTQSEFHDLKGVFEYDPVENKKHWRFPIFMTTLSLIDSQCPGRNKPLDPKDFKRTEDFVNAMKFWGQFHAQITDRDLMKAYFLFALALGAYPYEIRNEMIERFPGEGPL